MIRTPLLIATDVAARGLDIPQVEVRMIDWDNVILCPTTPPFLPLLYLISAPSLPLTLPSSYPPSYTLTLPPLISPSPFITPRPPPHFSSLPLISFPLFPRPHSLYPLSLPFTPFPLPPSNPPSFLISPSYP